MKWLEKKTFEWYQGSHQNPPALHRTGTINSSLQDPPSQLNRSHLFLLPQLAAQVLCLHSHLSSAAKCCLGSGTSGLDRPWIHPSLPPFRGHPCGRAWAGPGQSLSEVGMHRTGTSLDGPVVKNPLSSAKDAGSIPGQRLRSHMPQGN